MAYYTATEVKRIYSEMLAQKLANGYTINPHYYLTGGAMYALELVAPDGGEVVRLSLHSDYEFLDADREPFKEGAYLENLDIIEERSKVTKCSSRGNLGAVDVWKFGEPQTVRTFWVVSNKYGKNPYYADTLAEVYECSKVRKERKALRGYSFDTPEKKRLPERANRYAWQVLRKRTGYKRCHLEDIEAVYRDYRYADGYVYTVELTNGKTEALYLYHYPRRRGF